MIKIVVCDDELPFANYLTEQIQKIFKQHDTSVNISVYTEGDKMLSSIQPDTALYFLDIKMPEISGMELAAKILEKNPSTKLIFVSSFEHAVFESFRYQPLRFIRKDKLAEELPEAVEAFLSVLRTEHACITLHTPAGEFQILLSELIYVESNAHYLNFHCINTVYRVRGKLVDYMDILKPHGFIQPGKSFLVNCKYVIRFSPSSIEMQEGIRINVSRDKKDVIRSEYMKYTREALFSDAQIQGDSI